MRKPNTLRVDYAPGPAAIDALARSADLPRCREMSLQDRLDYLVISGLSALQHAQWQPPTVIGKKRQRWRGPAQQER